MIEWITEEPKKEEQQLTFRDLGMGATFKIIGEPGWDADMVMMKLNNETSVDISRDIGWVYGDKPRHSSVVEIVHIEAREVEK